MADAGKSIADQIKEQGELVRNLKAEKAGIDKVYEILTWISIAETLTHHCLKKVLKVFFICVTSFLQFFHTFSRWLNLLYSFSFPYYQSSKC